MTAPLLKDVDGETLYCEFLPLVEHSLGFEFGETELELIPTFGRFCEVVQAKMSATESDDCTLQQAFYKLRQVLAPHLPATAIMPGISLEELMPRSHRKRTRIIHAIEAELGFPLNIYGVPDSILTAVLGLFILSLPAFFFHWQVGVAGLLASLASGYLVGKFCQSFEGKTIRDVVEKMTRENYRQVRRNSNTISRAEIIPQIRALFHYELGIELNRLTPEARF